MKTACLLVIVSCALFGASALPYPENIPENTDSQSPVEAPTATEVSELADPTEKAELITTTLVPVVPAVKADVVPVVPELSEPVALEVEEPAPKAKTTVAKKKQVKKPVEDDDDDEVYPARLPTAAFFPMFFGFGGRSGAAGLSGPTAIANAYSTGRGGVATSLATAFNGAIPERKL